MLQKEVILAELASQLWGPAAAPHAYAVLDAAANDALLDRLYASEALKFECLFAGELTPDMAHVAPYLVALQQGDEFTQWVLQGWGEHWGIFLTSQVELPEMWRHLRALTHIYDADGSPMYFRFYDPRVLRVFLPSCDTHQLEVFFGPVDRFVAEGHLPEEGLVFTCTDGELVQARFRLGQAGP